MDDAKCKCQHCNGSISFDASGAGQTIECPHCNMETMLFIPKLPDPPSVAVPKVGERRIETPQKKFRARLKNLRANSAYPGLRLAINVVAGIPIVCALAVIFMSLVVAADRKEALLFAAPLIATAVATIAALLFAYGVSMLVIDIADALIQGDDAK